MWLAQRDYGIALRGMDVNIFAQHRFVVWSVWHARMPY